MSFKDDLKELRQQSNLTQKELAKHLYVTRQTVSAWETGKNMPNLETLHTLSQLFNIPLEKLLFGEEIPMNKDKYQSVATQIDLDVKLKKRYRLWTIALSSLISLLAVGVAILMIGYHSGSSTIDRINPFLSYQVGYAKLPHGKKAEADWTAWFTDNMMGNDWSKLTLATGENPGIKDPYVMAFHKGSYVKEARIVPKSYVNNFYISNLKGLEALNNTYKLAKKKSTKDDPLYAIYQKFHSQYHVMETVQGPTK